MSADTYIYAAIASCLSAIGSTFVIITYLYYELSGEIDRSILILEAFDLFVSIFTLIPTEYISSDFLCSVQAIFSQLFTLSEVLWTGCLALVMRKTLVNPNSNLITIPKLLLFTLITSGITSIIPVFFSDMYSSAGPYCWINNINGSLEKTLLSLFIFYIFCWLTTIFCFYIYSSTIKISQSLSGDPRRTKGFIIRMQMYPIIMLVCFLPISISRVLQFFLLEPPYGFFAFSSFMLRILGLANAITYGCSPRILSLFRKTKMIIMPIRLNSSNPDNL